MLIWVKELTIYLKPSKILGNKGFDIAGYGVKQAIDKEELFNGKELFN